MNLSGLNIFTPASPAPVAAQGRVASSSSAGEGPAAKPFEAELTESMPNSGRMPGLNGGMKTPDRAGPIPTKGPVSAPVQSQGKAKTGEPLVIEDSANSLTRRVVWNDFLRKMNDLGVSADDVMTAFASLSEEELKAPPEDTVAQMVNVLGLNVGLTEKDTSLAKQAFTDLISKTKSKTFGEEFDIAKKQASLSVLTQRSLQQKAMVNSLNNLERNFFMQKLQGPTAAPLAEVPMTAVPASQPHAVANDGRTSDSLEFAPMSATPAMSLDSALAPGLSVPSPTTMTAPATAAANVTAAATAASAAPSMPPTAQPAPANLDLLAAQMTPVVTPQTLSTASPSPVAPVIQAPMPKVSSSVGTTALAAGGIGAGLLSAVVGGSERNAETSSDDSGKELENGQYVPAGLVADATIPTSDPTSISEFQNRLDSFGMPTPMSADEAIQQAQVMIRDGGGEMKVTLTPEGMGEIAMRVQVENGKVSVHMITENPEAKKLLEQSMSELQSGLTQSNLQVDTIKVDTASNLGRQLEQQYDEAQRQMAQQNLEQFRQDQQGWRRSFFDVPGAKPYRSQAEAPRDINAPTDSNEAKRASSRRLNLVA